MVINVVQTPRLPSGVEAFSVLNADDSLTVLVSANLSPEKRHEAVLHEIAHIIRADFCSSFSAGKLEKDARKDAYKINWNDFDIHYNVVD
nr:MAG TPA: IrrE N-terminal-like domain [Caudoviricetes sp.]